MGELNRVATRVAGVVLAAAPAALALGTGISTADGPVGTNMNRATITPMSQLLRRCDHTDDTHVTSRASGNAIAVIGSSGSDVIAEVKLERGEPGLRYYARLIEMPPRSNRCGAGNPGVAVGTIDTDGGGNGNVTVVQPVLPGASGAWVFMEGPPGDVYSSDIVAPI